MKSAAYLQGKRRFDIFFPLGVGEIAVAANRDFRAIIRAAMSLTHGSRPLAVPDLPETSCLQDIAPGEQAVKIGPARRHIAVPVNIGVAP